MVSMVGEGKLYSQNAIDLIPAIFDFTTESAILNSGKTPMSP